MSERLKLEAKPVKEETLRRQGIAASRRPHGFMDFFPERIGRSVERGGLISAAKFVLDAGADAARERCT
ncbi:MAG: hypothetical protein K1V80_01000 [Muribaculaceae bacterium]